MLTIQRLVTFKSRHLRQIQSFIIRRSFTNHETSINRKSLGSMVLDNSSGTDAQRLSKRKTDLLIKEEEEEDLYPAIRDLEATTTKGIITFSVPCGKIRNYIANGFISKPMTLQYCHYLADVIRSADIDGEEDYYTKDLHVIYNFLMKSKEIPKERKFKLMSDVAHACPTICQTICNSMILADDELVKQIDPKNLSLILTSCLRHGFWQIADQLLDRYSDIKIVKTSTVQGLTEGLQKSSKAYKLSTDSNQRMELRNTILKILGKIIQLFQCDSVRFILKLDASVLIEALQDLDIQVKKNPNVKLSGRCTQCQSHLPMYNHTQLPLVNQTVKKLLTTKFDGLQCYSSPDELEDFFVYLESMYMKDKKPLDVVIDGLNIAYKRRGQQFIYTKKNFLDVEVTKKNFSKSSLSQVLINSIIRAGLTEPSKKVLLIGRDHMKNWPGLMNFLQHNHIYHFLTKNDSVDDLFSLYAATRNPKTLILSSDYFRNFLAGLNEEDNLVISRWLETHQASFDYKLSPLWPTPYVKIPSIDQENGCFHIPIYDFYKLNTFQDGEPPAHLNWKVMTWACCVFNNKQMTATDSKPIEQPP